MRSLLLFCVLCCCMLVASGQTNDAPTPAQRCQAYKAASYRLTKSGDYDSALVYARMMKEEALSNKLPAIANESEYYSALAYHGMGEWGKMKACYLTMIRFHRGNNKPAFEMQAWQALNGLVGENDTSHPTKTFIQEQIMRLSLQLRDTLTYARLLSDMGQSYITYGRINEAEKMLLKADEVLKKLRHIDRHYVLSWLSEIYIRKTNAARAAYYAEEAEAWRLEMGLPANSKDLRYDMWSVLVMFGHTDRSYREYFKILENRNALTETDPYYMTVFAWKINNEQGARKAIEYLEPKFADRKAFKSIYATAGIAIADFYILAGDTTRGMVYYRLIDRSLDLNYYGRQYLPSELFLRMANMYFNTGKYDSALTYLRRTEALYSGQITLVNQIKMHGLFYQADSAQGRYVAAINRYAKLQLLRDSLFNIQKWAEMEDMQVKYETAQKDLVLKQRALDIASLTEQAGLREALLEKTKLAARQQDMLKDKDILNARQEAVLRGDLLRSKEERIQSLNKRSELQQVVLDQTRFARNAIIAGAVLLFLLLLVIYSRYLLKQRSNRQLQRQQEEISHKNEALGKLVNEKEWLLKEIHHRVKNNLQVVMSLLNIQSFYLHDDEAISAIRDSQRRVNAISLIHKKLYQSDNPAVVDMPLYIQELVEQLREYSDTQQRISMEMDIDPVSLEVSKALPIGLILNEAVTNAFKYAFPENNGGCIKVSLKQHAGGRLALEIADNGIGWPQGSGPKPDSLGMSLMDGLAKDMDGELVIENKDGLTVRVTFISIHS